MVNLEDLTNMQLLDIITEKDPKWFWSSMGKGEKMTKEEWHPVLVERAKALLE